MFYMAAAPGAPVLEAAPHASHVPEHDPLSLTPPPPLIPIPTATIRPRYTSSASCLPRT